MRRLARQATELIEEINDVVRHIEQLKLISEDNVFALRHLEADYKRLRTLREKLARVGVLNARSKAGLKIV